MASLRLMTGIMASPKLRIEPTIGPMATTQLVRAPRRSSVEAEGRPAIVSVFAALYLVSGFACAALLLRGYGNQEVLEFAFGWPYPTLFLCGVAVAAGALLLTGLSVSWYFAAFLLVDSSALALWEAQRLFHDTVGTAAVSQYAASGLRLVLSLGLLSYLFSPEFRRFLKVDASHAWLGLLLLVVLEAALILAIGLGAS